MKKLILPILISVIAFTSCSKAHYKDKYNWVKVDRVETPLQKLPVETGELINEEPTELSAEADPGVVEPAIESVEKVAVDSVVTSQSSFAVTVKTALAKPMATVRKTALKSRKIAHSKKNQRQYGELIPDTTLGLVAMLLLLLLLMLAGPKLLAVILIIAYVFAALIAIAAICLLFYGIWWLFTGFLFMMDN